MSHDQVNADARAVGWLVRKMILDDAFSPLKLQQMKEGTRLEAAYQIKPVSSGRGQTRILQRFTLEAGEPPGTAPR